MEPNHVLSFWFEEVDPKFWWIKDAAFDEKIRKRFALIHLAATRGELYEWRDTADGRLAEIIVLDQFSRNMFRGTAQAFQSDPIALVLAQEAIRHKYDIELPQDRRFFVYMPFMHSESRAIHEVAVKLFMQGDTSSSLDFEKRHKAIIDRFGRYPHRNAIVGRKSTPEELEFLKEPGSSF